MRAYNLISLLQKMDPEAIIVIEGGDHSYRKADAYIGTAMQIGGDMYEDNNEPEGPKTGKRISIIVMR